MTDVSSGAFQPLPVANGLYYIGYRPGGFDVMHLAQAESLDRGLATDTATHMPKPSTVIDTEATVNEYSPWASLRPRWWLPHLLLVEGAAEVGVVTSGHDALDRHAYAVTLAADVDNGYPVGGFAYRYSPTNWVSFLAAASSINRCSSFSNLS